MNNNTLITSPDEVSAPNLSMSSRVVGNFPLKPSAGASLIYSTDFQATTLIGFNQDFQVVKRLPSKIMNKT